MKMLTPLIITLTVACTTHAGERFVQPVPPPPPPNEVLTEALQLLAQAPEPAKPRIAPGAPAPKALPAPAVAPLPPDEANININKGPHGAAVAWSGGAFKYGLAGSSSSSRRTLVIPKGDPNLELLADAEEDLNVMTVILEKALEQRSDDERKVMGIDIFSGSSGIRNVLIEGYGAIFTLKTKIALVPPPSPKKEDVKNKETTSTEWEEAKRQIYGPSDMEKDLNKALRHAQSSFGSSEEYDADKVQRLKDSLIEALKSASNIRHLSGDDTVTIAVLSSSSIGEVRKIVSGLSSAGDKQRRAEVYARTERDAYVSDSRAAGSRMMLQAKKSDIDAYAKGSLTTDTFRDKVKIQVY